MKFIFALMSIVAIASGENILFISNVPSPSHFIWSKSLLYSLHSRGHNITALSPDVEESLPNFTFLHLEQVYPTIYNGSKELDFFEFNKYGPIQLFLMYADISFKACSGSINSKGYKALQQYPKDFKFDLVIYDLTMDVCILSALSRFKNVPNIVAVSPFHDPGVVGHNLMYPAFVPGHDLLYPSTMNFQQRLMSTFVHVAQHLYQHYYLTPQIDKIVRKTQPHVSSLADYMKKVKLYLINNQPISDYKQPIFSNRKNVGGAQIKKPKALPANLKAIADNATNGLVLFSLGTNVRSDSLGDEIIKNILNALRRLNEYTFLWKFETKEKLPVKLPKNVHIQAWMPQNDILAHKNTKLFMSHCGLLSVQEALWYGVPILAFPVFGDQPQNALRMNELGVSETIEILNFTETQLYESIKNMLETKKYSQTAKKLSQALQDRPMTPIEEATYWTEWVIRNPDIDLEGATADLNLFARHSLDVFALIFFEIILFVYLDVKFIIWIIKRCFRKSPKPKVSDKKKKN